MSLILDALRKSERTRQQGLMGRLGSAETPPTRSRLPVPWATLLGLLLLVNAVVLGVLFLGPHPASAPVTASVVHGNPAPAPAADYHPSVRPLSQEAAASDRSPSPSAAAPAAPADKAADALPVSQPVIATNAAAIPSYDSLTPDQRQGLPPLHLDVHGYAADPAERFVVINLKRYRIGDQLAEGAMLKDILPQGAVLEYRGTLFLLPAN